MTTLPIPIALPAPRVRQVDHGLATTGRLRDGTEIKCFGTLVVSITDLPEVLRTNAVYRCQIELGRYVGSRRRGAGGRKMPGGLYHPSPWIGAAGSAGSGGTRGGGQTLPKPDVDRPSEWPVGGLPYGGSVLLTCAEVLAPWAQLMKVQDLNGGAVETLDFAYRRSRKSKRQPGYRPNTLTGVFAFRYAFFDVSHARWISGPWSDRIYASPVGYPMARYPIGPFPALDTVLPDRESFRHLGFSIGSRVR